MIDNMQNAMDRMASIRSAMGVGATTSAPPRTAAGSPESVRALFGQIMAQAASGLGRGTATEYAQRLTPMAGPRQSGAPRGLEGFANGRIPEGALVPLAGTTERMWAPAAAAFEHMRRDAAHAGVALPVVDAYRSHEDQVRLANELGLYRDGGLAAVPGTSQHGWGRAIDLDLDDAGLAWMRANAWKYGFVETVPREPWHWEFHPAAA